MKIKYFKDLSRNVTVRPEDVVQIDFVNAEIDMAIYKEYFYVEERHNWKYHRTKDFELVVDAP